VDCGGNCAPCGCTNITLTFVFDSYPEETSWDLLNDNNQVISSGGTYGSQVDGSTLNLTGCLPNGCYTLRVNDTYGDGMCCSYGQGSYSMVDGSNNVLASGGQFTSSESTAFCLGNNVQPSCNDGVQNGSETGIDCGGSNCPPCVNRCDYVVLNTNNFESGWGIWNDGGADCWRSNSFSAFANSGWFCVQMRDNSNTSSMTTYQLDLSVYDEIAIDFAFATKSMDNTGEDFWFQISFNNGSTFNTIEEWNLNDEFLNLTRYYDQVIIPGPFSTQTKFRFRCDASSDNDWVYIDDVVVSGCVNSSRNIETPELVFEELPSLPDESLLQPVLQDLTIYPIPSNDLLYVNIHSKTDEQIEICVVDMKGCKMLVKKYRKKPGAGKTIIETSGLLPGVYHLIITQGTEYINRKFVVTP